MKKKNCPDWDRIRSAYITGNDTPKECARKHGVNYRTLGNHLFNERWNEQRTAYRGAVADKAIGTAKNCSAYRIASKLTVLAHIVDALERELAKALEDGEQLHRYLVQTTKTRGLRSATPLVECRTGRQKRYFVTLQAPK